MMIKKFINERSKILLVTVILNIIIIFGIIPEFLDYSNWFDKFSMYFYNIDPSFTHEEIHLALSSQDFISLSYIHSILLACFMFASTIFNIASYIYRKLELQFISISFIALIIFVNFFEFDIIGKIIFILIIILNILAYIQQYKLNKTKN